MKTGHVTHYQHFRRNWISSDILPLLICVWVVQTEQINNNTVINEIQFSNVRPNFCYICCRIHNVFCNASDLCIIRLPTFVGSRHYRMMGSVCLSVCLSHASNSRMERPRKVDAVHLSTKYSRHCYIYFARKANFRNADNRIGAIMG